MKKFLAIVAVMVISLTATAADKAETFTGYLSDVLCGSSGYLDGYKGNEKFNLTVNPEKNTVMCLTMANCKATGYGIFIKQKDGKYKFYKFDKKGSDMAYNEILAKITNNMEPAPMIEVKGVMKGDAITVTSIKKLPSKGGASKGHMMDM